MFCFYLSALEKVHNHYIYSYISHLICYPFSKTRYSHVGTNHFFFFLLYFTLISGEEPCHGCTDIKPLLLLLSLLLLLLLLLLPSKYLLPHRIVPSVKFSHRFSFKSHLEHFQPLKKRTWLDIKEGAVSLNTMIIHPLECS